MPITRVSLSIQTTIRDRMRKHKANWSRLAANAFEAFMDGEERVQDLRQKVHQFRWGEVVAYLDRKPELRKTLSPRALEAIKALARMVGNYDAAGRGELYDIMGYVSYSIVEELKKPCSG